MAGAEDVTDLRLDKWLFHARIFKTRALAAARIEQGGIRINGQPGKKPGKAIRPGDELVVSAYGRVRVFRIEALGSRRGPAAEAQALYTELTEAPPQLWQDGLIDPPEGTR